jgi:hypothetical protein
VSTEVATLVLIDLDRRHRLWGFNHFLFGRFGLRRAPGLKLCKVMGSGHHGGFGLRPSTTRQGVFCVFDTEAQADDFLHSSPGLAAYRARGREFFVCKLRAFSSRGSWAGRQFEPTTERPEHGPIAALTRASIRPVRAAAFWRRSPPSERALAHSQGCLLAVGLGEAPLLRQATFSIWNSIEDMDAYARSGAHLEAIRSARQDGFFSESLFMRFVPLSMHGVWQGVRYG